jgi:hypothetical protein
MTQFSVRRALGLGRIAILVLGIGARTTIHGLALVIRAAELDGAVRRVADLPTTTVTARRILVPAGDVMLNARVVRLSG